MEKQENRQGKEKANWNIRPYMAMGLTFFLVIAASILFFFLVYRYHGFTKIVDKMMVILQPIIIGLILAYLVTPIVNFEERHLLPFMREKIKNRKKADKVVRGLSVAGALLFPTPPGSCVMS